MTATAKPQLISVDLALLRRLRTPGADGRLDAEAVADLDAVLLAASSPSRTPHEYAIQHGLYMAESAEAYLKEMNDNFDEDEGTITPGENTGSQIRHLNDAIYEFRSRAYLALATSKAPKIPEQDLPGFMGWWDGNGDHLLCYSVEPSMAYKYRPVYAGTSQEHTDLLGELYQVLGALDAPANVLDNVSAALNQEPLPHGTLLPFFVPDNVLESHYNPNSLLEYLAGQIITEAKQTHSSLTLKFESGKTACFNALDEIKRHSVATLAVRINDQVSDVEAGLVGQRLVRVNYMDNVSYQADLFFEGGRNVVIEVGRRTGHTLDFILFAH